MKTKPVFVLTWAAVLGLAALSFACSSRAVEPEASQEKGARPDGSATAATTQPAAPSVTVPGGTSIRVRLANSIDTARHRPGDTFSASVVDAVIVDGTPVIPQGAEVTGIVRTSSPSGRLKGRAVLSIALQSVRINGLAVPVRTASVSRMSSGHKKRNVTLIGGGSGVGALIGGIAGGGAGALIGAGAGAAAGTAGAAITGRRQVRIPAESVLVFRLSAPLTL